MSKSPAGLAGYAQPMVLSTVSHMYRRRVLLVSLLCWRLSGAPIPLAHSHAGLTPNSLATHLAQHHSQSSQIDEWHWHFVSLGESDQHSALERSEIDLSEIEVYVVSELDREGSLLGPPSHIHLATRSQLCAPARSVGRTESYGGSSDWRDLLCVRTL